jgi:hypothetical protein
LATREAVEELAHLLWEQFRGRRITLDRLGRPNYLVTRSLARRLLELASAAGVRDPLREIDWIATLDPELTPFENLRLTFTWLQERYGRRPEVSDEVDVAISELERYMAYLRDELERASPDERAGVEEELRRAERELEELKRAKRPAERRVRPPPTRPPVAPPAPPVAPPAPPPPPPPPPPPRVPVEEARSRIELHVRSKVPRVYRFDWTDLRCRISYHRAVEGDLRRAVEELGGRVERIVEARPPLRIMYADFSTARVPPAPVAPELERMILWSKFSAILTAMGVVRPEEYAREFEEELSVLAGRPFEEKQRAIEMLARDIARRVAPPPPPPPPPPPAPPEILARLDEVVRRLERLESAVAWRPRSAEELRMAVEAAYLVEPEILLRVDASGHPFVGPSDKTLQTLAQFLDRWALLWFTSCPLCRARLPGGYLSVTEFAEHLIAKERAVPPVFLDWFRRFARTMEEAERGARA